MLWDGGAGTVVLCPTRTVSVREVLQRRYGARPWCVWCCVAGVSVVSRMKDGIRPGASPALVGVALGGVAKVLAPKGLACCVSGALGERGPSLRVGPVPPGCMDVSRTTPGGRLPLL